MSILAVILYVFIFVDRGIPEFIIYSTRDGIYRYDLKEGGSPSKLYSVSNEYSCIEFEYKYNCIFFENENEKSLQFGTTSERVSSDSKSKAKAYLSLLKSRNVIEFLLFLMDIFAPLKRMSLVLQDRNTTLSSLYCVLASTIEVIEKYRTRHMSNCGEKASWEVINNELRENLPNILELIDFILSLSPSSAEAERGFSQLKLIKTNLSRKMGNELLNQSMIMKLHSPSISNFNPDDAITVWNTTSLRGRRPLSTPLGKGKTDSQSLSQSESIINQETNEVEVENDADDLVIVPDDEPLQTDELVEEDSDTEFESIQEILDSVEIEHELKID